MNSFLKETNDFFSQYMPTVTRRFFFALAIIFVCSQVLLLLGGVGNVIFQRLLVLVPYQAVEEMNVWQFVTYMFGHSGMLHFFFNVLALFFFGRLIEDRLGGRRFFWFVILSGLAGGILHSIIYYATGQTSVGLIGFSGAIFAIIIAAVVLYPNMTVYFFMFPVPMKVLGVLYVFFIFVGLLGDFRTGFSGGGISNLAHAAGAVSGFLLIKYPQPLGFLAQFHLPSFRRKKKRKGGARVIGMGHPGRHSDPDDRYNDPHWYLDQ